jgi:hypothetical protein
MCELCTAKTTYLGSPLPGWHLSRATQNGDWMLKGQYGLTMFGPICSILAQTSEIRS